MRFDGTDTALMILQQEGDADDAFLKRFKEQYKSEFGFVLENKEIIIDDIKVCSHVTRLKLLQFSDHNLCLGPRNRKDF